jgi:hypothetical protein
MGFKFICMTTQQRIDYILSYKYNNFRGAKMQVLKELHETLRAKISEEEYLAFLEKALLINPPIICKSNNNGPE